MKNIVFIGPPGSGKGTQTRQLAEKLNLRLFSTGTLLRKEVSADTPIGRKVKKQIYAGKLAPNRIVNKMILDILAKNGPDFILEGYPRNISQARKTVQFFKERNWTMIVFELKLSDEIAVERIASRRTCVCGRAYHLVYDPPKKDGYCDACGRKLIIRDDQRPLVVKKRLELYHQITEPMIGYLRSQTQIDIEYHPIDSTREITAVLAEIISKL